MLRSSFIFNRDKLKHYDFMKHQQVVVDYTNMLNSSMTCVMLAFLGWVLIKLIQAIFTMPGYLRKENEREALDEQLKLEQERKEAEEKEKMKHAESEEPDEAPEASIEPDESEPLLCPDCSSKGSAADTDEAEDDDDGDEDDDDDDDDEEFVESNGDVSTVEEKKIK